jgi:RNA polymerase sigma-70 factor (ECF subfamily)
MVRTHQDAIFNLCYRMIGDYHEAEDCAQEAFARACHGLPRFEERSSLFTWLYRIAVNTCRNRIRAIRRRRTRLGIRGFEEAGQAAADESSASPPDRIHRSETERGVRRAVLSLPAEQRIMVVLRDLEGRSYEEISEATGVSLGTVRSRLFRARKALARELRKVLP